MDVAVAASGMECGGITPVELPPEQGNTSSMPPSCAAQVTAEHAKRVPGPGPGERNPSSSRQNRAPDGPPTVGGARVLFGGGLSDLTFVVLPESVPRCTLKPSTGGRAPWAS